MANITAGLVKELREITNAGMMDCKKALVETEGNLEKAIELLRKKGQAKAAKKSDRTTAEGLVATAASSDNKVAAIVEVNCETDFVAREARFIEFVNKLATLALNNKATAIESLSGLEFDAGITVEEKRLELVTQIGENITLRRAEILEAKEGVVASYVHGSAGSARIATLVGVSVSDVELARDIAMQVAAMKPDFIDESYIPEERKSKEKEILLEQAKQQNSDKPVEILEKIVSGRMSKFIKELTLVGQPFVKDQDKLVSDILGAKKAKVENMIRFEVGEGIEKKEDNFVEEVMSQVKN